jgi:fibronectin-binding autotransporter adhesin
MPSASLTVVGGSFSNNAVAGGTPVYDTGPNAIGNRGSAYGADLFLGANVTFSIAGGQSVSVNSLGGAGNLTDPNVANNANDPNAQGGIIKTGAGNLTLTGTSYYSGITTVNSGTLTLAAGANEQGTTVVTVGQNVGDVATLALLSSSVLHLGGFNGTSGTDAPVVIAQAAGSTGNVIIGSGPGTSGADIGARVFTGGAGNATVRFTQQYAAGSPSDLVYPFYTTLTGSLGIVQDGLGTTSLQPLHGVNTFAGPVTVNLGTLATTGTAAALAGATSIAVNAGGALLLGQTNGVNDSAAVTLSGGGELFTGTSLSETFGALNLTGGGWSIINFLGNSSTLNFSSLSIGGSLAILNYTGADDFLNIASGTATGSLSQIAFYSDSGSTLLGYGGFEGTRLVPVAVPEPSTWAMALAGLACGCWILRRQKPAGGPRLSSLS